MHSDGNSAATAQEVRGDITFEIMDLAYKLGSVGLVAEAKILAAMARTVIVEDHQTHLSSWSPPVS